MTEAGDERLLLVRCVQKSDAGLYRVTIQNDAGRMQATARLSVIGQYQLGSNPWTPLRIKVTGAALGVLVDSQRRADVRNAIAGGGRWLRGRIGTGLRIQRSRVRIPGAPPGRWGLAASPSPWLWRWAITPTSGPHTQHKDSKPGQFNEIYTLSALK